MKIIRPATVTTPALLSSTVADTPAAWSAATTYALDARVQDPTTHREYESQQANNQGHPLYDASWWLDVGATNRWRMFDQTNSSQTTASEEITVEIKIASRVNAIALLNCEAGMARISATVNGATVYDATYSMTSASGISDWYAYFNEPIERRPDLIVTDLPLYSNMIVRVSLTRPGGMVKIGTLVIGAVKELGFTLMGMSAGIVDYSRKVTDDFGNAMLVERAFAKKLDARVVVENSEVDQVNAILTQLRATPVVWVATTRFAAAGVYGFYRNFTTTFEYPEQSICLLEIEGLT